MSRTKEAAYDEVFHSQAHYRALLDSMARPGKINPLENVPLSPPPGFDRASACVALALLDSDVSFSALHAAEGVAAYVASTTNAREVDDTAADFQFAEGARAAEAIARTRAGTLLYPETGATVVVSVSKLSPEPIPDSVALTLRGPGIESETRLWVSGIAPMALDELQEKNQEHPMGVDTVLCCEAAHVPQVACIPRTTSVRWTL